MIARLGVRLHLVEDCHAADQDQGVQRVGGDLLGGELGVLDQVIGTTFASAGSLESDLYVTLMSAISAEKVSWTLA